MALGVTSVACSAQVEKAVLTPAKSKQTSNAVTLDSVKKVLPDPIANSLHVLAGANEHAWNVNFTPASENVDLTHYYVYLKGKNGKQTLVYDKNGNLLQVKQVMKNVEVPEPVKRTLNTKFNRWTLIANEERHIFGDEKTSSDYKVILKKGFIKKAVLLDPEGDIKISFPSV